MTLLSKSNLFIFYLIYLVFSSYAVSLDSDFGDENRNSGLRRGTMNSEFNTRIVGGQEATPGQFPFQVSLQVLNYLEQYVHNCGGVIYNENHVITASHCVKGYHPYNLRIVAGAHDLANSTEGTHQIRYVRSYVFHPDYDSQSLENDIAVLTLDPDNPLVFNNRVQKVNLPPSYIEAAGEGVNSGWGNIRGDGQVEIPTKLHYARLDIINRTDCQQRYSGYGTVTNANVCAGGKNGANQGACNGDSGGPLICSLTSDGLSQYLCGVVSWGMIPCAQSRFPTVYTNIANYIDWLQGILPPVL